MFDEKLYAKNRLAIQQALDSDNLSKAEPATAEIKMDPHVFRDSHVPSVGNLFAYKKFVKENPDTGIYLNLDINSFKILNTEHGVDKGNTAIKDLFNLLANLTEQYNGRVFRVRGDEAKILLPDTETAQKLSSELKAFLEQDSAVHGTNHKISVCMGLGFSPEHAEKALAEAKQQIKDENGIKKFKAGEEPVHISSLLHESPPPNWHPFSGQEGQAGGIFPSGLKLQHPLK